MNLGVEQHLSKNYSIKELHDAAVEHERQRRFALLSLKSFKYVSVVK